MKIGILTQPLKTNYGGLLQAYALQKVLKNQRFEPVILDRDFKETGILEVIKSSVKSLIIKAVNNKPNEKEFEVISRNTNYFIKNYMQPVSQKINSDREINFFDFSDYGAIIVGSDQVWRPKYSPSIYNYFLDFLNNKTNYKNVKRISYAASFGVDNWEFNDRQSLKSKKLAAQFDAISVREDSAINLCKSHLGVEAVHVLDPTMLLDKSDYIDLFESESEPQSEGDLMTYVLDMTNEKRKFIDDLAKHYGLKSFTVMQSKPYTKNGILKDSVFPNVTKWIKGFADAKFVVTDSFHGTVFAILFNKPFFSFGNRSRGVSRFTSILGLLGLSDRLITEDFIFNDNMINKKIDWDTVNSKLKNEKLKSLNFLKDSLK